MPLLHCKECHHEWEGRAETKCDWCGADSLILEKETQFEKMCRLYQEIDWEKLVSANRKVNI